MSLEASAPTWWAWPLQLTHIWQTWIMLAGCSHPTGWCSLDFPINSVAILELTWAWGVALGPTTWASINHSINLLNLYSILRLILLTLPDLVLALLHSRRMVSKSWERNPLNLKMMRARESLQSCSTSQIPKLRIVNMKNRNMTSATTQSPSKIQPLN